MFKTFLCLKTKQNPGMNKEEHSGSEFYYQPKEQETAELKDIIREVMFVNVIITSDKIYTTTNSKFKMNKTYI